MVRQLSDSILWAANKAAEPWSVRIDAPTTTLKTTKTGAQLHSEADAGSA
jgi:hypothetical protein